MTVRDLTGDERLATQALLMMDFESAAQIIKDSKTLSVADEWQRTLGAIETYLASEENGGKAVRELSGALGMGPEICADCIKLGDEGSQRHRQLRPVFQIVYDTYIARGGDPYTDEQLQEARAAFKQRRKDYQQGLN